MIMITVTYVNFKEEFPVCPKASSFQFVRLVKLCSTDSLAVAGSQAGEREPGRVDFLVFPLLFHLDSQPIGHYTHIQRRILISGNLLAYANRCALLFS